MQTVTQVAEAKRIVKSEIEDSEKILMVIRGTGTDVSSFADDAAIRADAMPWREAVWLKMADEDVDKVIADFENWFADHHDACAAILDFNGTAKEWLKSDATLFNIDTAFWNVKE